MKRPGKGRGFVPLRQAPRSPYRSPVGLVIASCLILLLLPTGVTARQDGAVPTPYPETEVEYAEEQPAEAPAELTDEPPEAESEPVEPTEPVAQPVVPNVSAAGVAPVPLGIDLSLLQQNPDACLTYGLNGQSVWIWGNDAIAVGPTGLIAAYQLGDQTTTWEVSGATVLGVVAAGSDGAGALPAYLYDYRPFGALPSDAGLGTAATSGTGALFCVVPDAPPVEPTAIPTETFAPPLEPTQAPIEPTEVPVEPTEPPIEPTEAPAEPTEGPTEPTEPPVEPTDEAPAEPSEPTEIPAEPTDPTEVPAEPTEAPADPTEAPVEPTATPDGPRQTGSDAPRQTGSGPMVSAAVQGEEEHVVVAAAVGSTVQTNVGLNMRFGPGTTQAVIAVLPPGTTGSVLEGPVPASGYQWWRINTPQGTGWVAGDYLVTVADAPTPTATATLEAVGGASVGSTVRTIAPLNLRSSPSLKGSVLAVLPPGATGTIHGGPIEASGYTWWRISSSAGAGWVAAQYLTPMDSAGPGSPSPAPSPSASATPTGISNTMGIGDSIRVTAPLNMRSGTSTTSSVLTVLPINTTGSIVAGPQAGSGYSWFQISTSSGTGWVVSNYIQKTGQGSPASPTATPTASSTPGIPNTQGIAIGDTVRSTAPLNVRSSPSTNAGIVGIMPQGTQGSVLGGPQSANGYLWWRVSTPSSTGWVAGSFLTKVTGQPGATATATPVPTQSATPTPPVSNPQGIKVGDSVRTTAAVNMRSTPSLAGTILTVLPQGREGSIVGGPEVASGHTWWRVQTSSGTGWVAGSFLSIGSGQPGGGSPTPSPTPFPPPQNIDPYHMGNPPGANWANINRWNTQILAAVNQVQNEQGIRVPPDVVKAVMMIESGGTLHPANWAGYGGLMGSPARPGAVAWTSAPVDHARVVNDPFYSVYIGVDELANWYRAVGTGSWEDAAAAHFSGWNYNNPNVGDGWNTVASYRNMFRNHISVLQAN